MRSRIPHKGARQGRRGQAWSECGGSDCWALRQLQGEAMLCLQARAPAGGRPSSGVPWGKEVAGVLQARGCPHHVLSVPSGSPATAGQGCSACR